MGVGVCVGVGLLSGASGSGQLYTVLSHPEPVKMVSMSTPKEIPPRNGRLKSRASLFPPTIITAGRSSSTGVWTGAGAGAGVGVGAGAGSGAAVGGGAVDDFGRFITLSLALADAGDGLFLLVVAAVAVPDVFGVIALGAPGSGGYSISSTYKLPPKNTTIFQTHPKPVCSS